MRWLLGVCSIRVLVKNHGDPYYEPTIVVHDKDHSYKKLGDKNGHYTCRYSSGHFIPIIQDEVWIKCPLEYLQV